jgi:hypothetical protein
MIVGFSVSTLSGWLLMRVAWLRHLARWALGTDVLPGHWRPCNPAMVPWVALLDHAGDTQASDDYRTWHKRLLLTFPYLRVAGTGRDRYQVGYLWMRGDGTIGGCNRCDAWLQGPVALRLGHGPLIVCGWWDSGEPIGLGEAVVRVVDESDLSSEIPVL